MSGQKWRRGRPVTPRASGALDAGGGIRQRLRDDPIAVLPQHVIDREIAKRRAEDDAARAARQAKKKAK